MGRSRYPSGPRTVIPETCPWCPGPSWRPWCRTPPPPHALGDLEKAVAQPLASAHRLQNQASPESETLPYPEGLPAIHRHPANPLLPHPQDRGLGLGYQHVDQLRVRKALGQAHKVVVKVVLGVAADLYRPDLFLGEVRHRLDDVLQPVEGESKAASGEVGVATPEVNRRLLQHQHPGPVLPRRDGRAQRGVTRPHHHHIVLFVPGHSLPSKAPSRLLLLHRTGVLPGG